MECISQACLQWPGLSITCPWYYSTLSVPQGNWSLGYLPVDKWEQHGTGPSWWFWSLSESKIFFPHNLEQILVMQKWNTHNFFSKVSCIKALIDAYLLQVRLTDRTNHHCWYMSHRWLLYVHTRQFISWVVPRKAEKGLLTTLSSCCNSMRAGMQQKGRNGESEGGRGREQRRERERDCEWH